MICFLRQGIMKPNDGTGSKWWFRFIKPAAAHCDIPCGIYETATLTTAAQTCQKLVDLALTLAEAGDHSPAGHSQFIRAINQKEIQAQICKDQIYILWSDYFRAADFEASPKLHQQLWEAAKACSHLKQTLDRTSADKLVKSCQTVADIFATVEADRSTT